MKNPVILQLTNGLSVICRVSKSSKNLTEDLDIGTLITTEPWIEISDALVVGMGPGKDGGISLQFMPYLIYANEPHTLQTSHIISVSEPEEEFRNQYNSKFGTGIVTPSSASKKVII